MNWMQGLQIFKRLDLHSPDGGVGEENTTDEVAIGVLLTTGPGGLDLADHTTGLGGRVGSGRSNGLHFEVVCLKCRVWI